MHAALVSIADFFKNILKILLTTNFWMVVYIIHLTLEGIAFLKNAYLLLWGLVFPVTPFDMVLELPLVDDAPALLEEAAWALNKAACLKYKIKKITHHY